MPETGQSWQQAFKALPEEAAQVRAWVGSRVQHIDAVVVAHELFVAILGTRPDVIEMTLSTAGARARITASGPAELHALHTHGPGLAIIAGLSRYSGVTTDTRGMWAQMQVGP
ncbi:hypothetical protein ACF068_14455 [Streptomyces sp. NPDC016309]|uniref:hypothetical protein n=1 Tax=Streptomyces sp. NPDC016309 TaxID=3364965 RepID=UPI0036FEDA17